MYLITLLTQFNFLNNLIICILDIKNEHRKVSQSIERYCCDFTPDERRVLYDTAVKNTKLPYHDDVRNELITG